MRRLRLGRWILAAALPALMYTFTPLASAAEERPADKKPAAKAFLGVGAGPTEEGAQQGALVRDVAPDGPAAKAGFKPGDVIVKAGDRDIKGFEALADVMANHKPGDKVTFHVMRDGKEQKLEVTLGERPARRPGRDFPGRNFFPGRESPAERQGAFLGVQTQEMTADLKDRLGVGTDKGALVTDVMPRTPAAKAGLKQDDVITAVNGKAVNNPEELRDAVRKAGVGKEVTVSVMRGKEKMDVKAKLQEAPVAAFPRGPEGAERFFRGEFPRFFESGEKVQDLERRVRELEKQVHGLQQKLEQSKK